MPTIAVNPSTFVAAMKALKADTEVVLDGGQYEFDAGGVVINVPNVVVRAKDPKKKPDLKMSGTSKQAVIGVQRGATSCVIDGLRIHAEGCWGIKLSGVQGTKEKPVTVRNCDFFRSFGLQVYDSQTGTDANGKPVYQGCRWVLTDNNTCEVMDQYGYMTGGNGAHSEDLIFRNWIIGGGVHEHGARLQMVRRVLIEGGFYGGPHDAPWRLFDKDGKPLKRGAALGVHDGDDITVKNVRIKGPFGVGPKPVDKLKRLTNFKALGVHLSDGYVTLEAGLVNGVFDGGTYQSRPILGQPAVLFSSSTLGAKPENGSKPLATATLRSLKASHADPAAKLANGAGTRIGAAVTFNGKAVN